MSIKYKESFEIKNINKYNLTPTNIKKLKVNRDLLNEENGFWRNNVINAWCISEEIGVDYDSTEYWLGVYDKPNADGSTKIKLSFTVYGGMCGYEFKKFFNPAEIEHESDYIIQYEFIKKMNELIDKGIFLMGDKGVKGNGDFY